ncbi:capping protein-inhibiting regulator of actin dynamics isoform X2 [Amphiprion ocellaris]|uniref:capping protein-inhibiting regulator of actin dynamics isoform X2 n=1 Tax=Amphiprion ocellaris TaxID=80972 RepID=UPI0024110A9C|nr:capping protein-inhibiting regulator of actin dynamics isoform X2 [Amphiprion ocellaris]
MSWFQSLRDEFTLRPFEIQHTRDGAAMASGPPDVTTNQEPAEVQEECSGKKKSKFQTFKKFFARKKRKDPSAAGADAGLKASQSSDNVSKTSENNTLIRSEKEKGSGSKISLGSKALSHDSVFVSDSSEANEALGASQDSIHGKVKSLQLQLKQAIKLGSPPSLMCVKRTEDAGTLSEDDGLPCSPPEYTTLHTAMNQTQRNSSISLEGIDSDDDQLSYAASSRAVSPLVVPGDFSQPASPFVCLDNSAAKHKLGLRHKACNKRKPVSRLEQKPEGGAVEEMLTTSILETETEALEERQQRRIEDLIVDQLKAKVQTEDDDEDEKKQKPQHSRESLLGDKEQRREEEEDELPTEQEVSHSPDTSFPPEPSLSEEEASEHPPSSKPSSSASSADSPRATPEPPAVSREYLLDSPGFSNESEENKDESDSASEAEDDDRVQETREEEESSFLQEVLSSLKTPLVSLDVETEGVVLEVKEEREDEEMSEEVKEEEENVDEPVGYQAPHSSSVLSAQTTEEEKEADTPSWQEEEEVVGTVQEEVKGGEEEAEEEEDLDVDRLREHDDAEERQVEEAVEVKPKEEEDMHTRQTISQAGKEEEDDEDEEEEEDTELEKEPEIEEKGEEDGYEEVEMNDGRGAEEAEEAMEEEEEEAEERTEMLPDAEEVQSAIPMQEDDECVVLGVETTKPTKDDDDDIPTEPCDQEHTLEEKEQENFNQNSDGEEGAEEDVQIDLMDQKSDQEEDVEANQPDVDQPEDDQEQDSVEIISHLDVKEVEKEPSEATEQAPVSSKPPSLSLPESHYEAHSQDSGATSPSKTSTIHINLVSPSSEKTTFQLPPTAADPGESITESPDSTEPNTASVTEEPSDCVEEDDQLSIQEREATTPASVEETVNQPPCSLDQNKVRFTIAPAWQRTKSLTPPSSPPACVSSFSAVTGPQSEDVEAATKEESVVKPEPANEAKAELVLSPSRLRNTGCTTAKPQNNTTPVPVKPQISTAASTEESSVVVEGNPDNPFGVRLRKTSGLLRFSSEEENTEPSLESPTQPTSCKVESLPISVKPSLSQPISNKPALPKKPEVTGDSGAKPKRVSDPAAGRSVSAGSESPSWISVAKQKQKIYKENSLEEITVKKEEQERKSSLPMYVSSAASKEQSNKTAESTGKVSLLDISKPSVSAEKDTRRALSPPAPVPPQPSKSQPPPCPVAPKPQLPPATAKHPQQPTPPQRSPPTPVPVLPKSPSCTSPTSFTKPTSPSKTSPVTSPPFLPRTAPEKSATRPPGPSGQTASSQRAQPSPALPQDEPPWMALAKKKAKAWSEMPQIVQ